MKTTIEIVCDGACDVVNKYLTGELAKRIIREIVSEVKTGLEGNEPGRMAAEEDFHDCVNELCLRCGQYKREHEGACDGCRWLKPRRGW